MKFRVFIYEGLGRIPGNAYSARETRYRQSSLETVLSTLPCQETNTCYRQSSIKRHIVALLLGLIISFATAFQMSGQTTKVKGRVTDASSGEPIPFAAIYFEGTTIGVSTDMDGCYLMETRDTSASILCAALLGYETQAIKISRGAFSEVDFRLRLVTSSLNAAVVKPDNHYMKWILSQIDSCKVKNDPERRGSYICDTYTKMELDLSNAATYLKNKLIRKNFGFIFDYMDTSVVSGQSYLPVMISETRATRYHSTSPTVNKEVIEASRISGMNEDNAASQFTGSMHLKTNFYNNFINAFNIEIPSPLSSNGNVYYNYYLIDSLQVDGRKTWKIRFHPVKTISSPAFDGEMSIDAEDFGLREIHAKLKKGSNINWVRDMMIDRTDQRLGDSLWFYKQDKLYVDFSVTMNDSSKFMSFLGNRQIDYMNPVVGDHVRNDVLKTNTVVQVAKDAGLHDDEWWANARPYALSEKEQNIYVMVDSIKNAPLYNTIYNIVNTALFGYLETKYIGFGPYSRLYSFNNLEGNRVQFGVRTTSELSKKFRVGTYLAYGFKDKEFKGGATFEWMFSKQPTRKLTFSAKHDIIQLGKGNKAFNESNIMSSLLSKKGSAKRSLVNEYFTKFEWEITPWLNTSTSLEFNRIYSNRFVPMLRVTKMDTPGMPALRDTISVNSVGANAVRFVARFSKDETVSRGTFDKSYLHSAYPIVTLDLLGSLKGIGHNEYSYFRTELNVDYKLRIPPVGVSDIQFTAGKIIGRVPYPMLKLHEGNGTYILDKSSFSCMAFYEFASDTWTTFTLEHNFGGFFLGKIPYVKKLQLREIFTLKAAYGTLSDKNNGILGNKYSCNAPMLFPAGMRSLNTPYVEVGAGITNILRLLRVDTFWRLTHRYVNMPDGTVKKSPNCFVVNIGLELNF